VTWDRRKCLAAKEMVQEPYDSPRALAVASNFPENRENQISEKNGTKTKNRSLSSRGEGSEANGFVESWCLNSSLCFAFRNGAGNRIVLFQPKTNPSVGNPKKKHRQPANKPVGVVIHDYLGERAI